MVHWIGLLIFFVLNLDNCNSTTLHLTYKIRNVFVHSYWLYYKYILHYIIIIFFIQGFVELVCHLPHEYPKLPPEVFLRAPKLFKYQHKQLNEALQSFVLDDLARGELYLGSIIQWLQDNDEEYLEIRENQDADLCKDVKVKDTKFSRMWVYSHHIYSKIKRKDILDFSKELNLTGFCMPGKPGMICIEGDNNEVEEFWHRIRRMQWKRLVMKEKEDTDLIGENSVDTYRKFDGFEEKHFEPRQGKGRGSHADRGLLYQFLEKKGCGHMFQIYFGVEGRIGEESD